MAIGRITYARPLGGRLTVPVMNGLEGATQSWVAGGVLIKSGGYVVEASNGAETEILGIATGDASGTTGTAVEFIPALPDILFEFTLDNQAASPLTSAQTHQWETYGIYQEAATGYFYIDVNVTGDCVMVVDFVDAVGTAQARVLGVFCNQATNWV